MCGRAVLVTPVSELAAIFDVPLPSFDAPPPRFNVAPSQPMVTVRRTTSRRELALAQWGLVPWWAKPEERKKIASRCIQARAETIAKSPAFRHGFAKQRCLIVLDGYYEWKTLPDGKRVPHHVKKRSGGPLAMGAVWDRWRGPDGTELESCAVVTRPSAGPVAAIHDRMPLVISPGDFDAWLEGSREDALGLTVATPSTTDDLLVFPVSTWVNDVRHDDPHCVDPARVEEDAGVGPAGSGAETAAGSSAEGLTLTFEPSKRRRAK